MQDNWLATNLSSHNEGFAVPAVQGSIHSPWSSMRSAHQRCQADSLTKAEVIGAQVQGQTPLETEFGGLSVGRPGRLSLAWPSADIVGS